MNGESKTGPILDNKAMREVLERPDWGEPTREMAIRFAGQMALAAEERRKRFMFWVKLTGGILGIFVAVVTLFKPVRSVIAIALSGELATVESVTKLDDRVGKVETKTDNVDKNLVWLIHELVPGKTPPSYQPGPARPGERFE